MISELLNALYLPRYALNIGLPESCIIYKRRGIFVDPLTVIGEKQEDKQKQFFTTPSLCFFFGSRNTVLIITYVYKQV